MASGDVELIAHLMRRGGFGASRRELAGYAAGGYEAAVEDLLDTDNADPMPDDVIRRYHPDQSAMMYPNGSAPAWLYRMMSTKSPLEEKVALLWHGIFATGYPKITQGKVLSDQTRMFRHHGLSSFKKLLVELSKDPAMIVWLDNHENHDGAINENYGRELLELFSMGVGNYTEQDIKECARAFTGWTLGNTDYMAYTRTARLDLALRPHRLALRVQARRPRRGREGVPGREGQPQRRGHHRHHLPAACNGPVHRPAPVPLLRGRRASRAVVALRAAPGPGGDRDTVAGVLRPRLRHPLRAAGAVQLRLLQVPRAAGMRRSRAPPSWSWGR